MAKQIMLYYGHQVCEDGIYHSFEAVNAKEGKDEEMSAKLAEALDVDVNDPDFNWNCMYIQLPGSTVDEIKAEAIHDFFLERKDRILLLLNFETGVPGAPIDQIPVVVEDGSLFNSDELSDCFCSYYDSLASEGKSNKEAAEEVLSSMRWKWHFVSVSTPACKSICNMYL